MHARLAETPETARPPAVLGGSLDFKDEGATSAGLPFGKLTLHSTGAAVHRDGRWVTKREAERIAGAWGVELFES